MDKISFVMGFVTISLIIVWFSITITMTNVFGNNKSKITTYDKLPLQGDNPASRCIGSDDAKYTLYNSINTKNNIVLKECEGIISDTKNIKVVVQSDGRIVTYDKDKGIIKSTPYFTGPNPYSLLNDGKVYDSTKDKPEWIETYFIDIFKRSNGRSIKINEGNNFSYDA